MHLVHGCLKFGWAIFADALLKLVRALIALLFKHSSAA